MTDSVWERVEQHLARRTEGVRRNPDTTRLAGREKGHAPPLVWGNLLNPLARLLTCAECGGPVNVHLTKRGPDGRLARYLGCSRCHHNTACCPNAGIVRLSDVEGAVVGALRHHFSDAELARQRLARFMRELQSYRDRLTADEQSARQTSLLTIWRPRARW